MIFFKKINNLFKINNIFNEKIKKIIKKSIFNIKCKKIFIFDGIIFYNNKYISKILKIKYSNKIYKKKKYYKIKFKFFKNIKINIPIYFIIINTKKFNNNYKIILNIKNHYKISIIDHHILINKKNNYNYIYKLIISSNTYVNYFHFIYSKKNFFYNIKYYVNIKKKSQLNKFIIYWNILNIKFYSKIILQKKSKINTYYISILKYKNNHIYKNKIIHNFKSSKSNLIHKSLILEKSKFEFIGLININKNSYNSIAYLKNFNLNLNKNSIINSFPYLKIFNNKTICKHKILIKNINKKYKMFLLQKGINNTKINNLLSMAFIINIINKINIKKLKIIIFNKLLKYFIK